MQFDELLDWTQGDELGSLGVLDAHKVMSTAAWYKLLSAESCLFSYFIVCYMAITDSSCCSS